MLGNLFKYDLRALSWVLVPLHVAVLGVAVVAGIAGFAGYVVGDSPMGDALPSTVPLSGMIMAVFVLCLLAMFSASIATMIVIVHRFYCNVFTDEGYLTLTLPVSAHQIVLAKLLSGLLWMVVDVAVIFACGVAVSAAAYGFSMSSLGETLPYWMLSVQGGGSFGEGELVQVFVGAVNGFSQIVLVLLAAYAAFSLGAVVSARHKVAAGVAFFVLFAWLGGAFVGIVSVIAGSWIVHVADLGPYFESMTWVASMVGWFTSLLVASGCYAPCVHLVGRKVNLA